MALSLIQDKEERVGDAIKWATMQRNAFAHVIMTVEKCGNFGDFEQCSKTKQNKERTQNRSSGQSPGGFRGNPKYGKRGGNPQSQRNVHQVTEETMDPNHANNDDFYVFSTGNSEGQNTIEMLIEDKPVNVMIDSRANCNLMSEEVFESTIGGYAILLECNKRVYAYASVEPLKLRGSII